MRERMKEPEQHIAQLSQGQPGKALAFPAIVILAVIQWLLIILVTHSIYFSVFGNCLLPAYACWYCIDFHAC